MRFEARDAACVSLVMTYYGPWVYRTVMYSKPGYRLPLTTRMSDELEERWRFMRRWCSPVRGRLHMGHVERLAVPRVTYIGLDVGIFDYAFLSPRRVRGVREALILLTMVARVDPQAWKHVLNEHCEFELPYEHETLESDEFQQPRFLFTLDEEGDGDGTNTKVLKGFFSGLDASPSDGFVEAMQTIASFCDQSVPHHVELLDIPISVDIDASAEDTAACVAGVWRELKTLRSKHGAWRFPVCLGANDGRSTGFECVFVLGPVEIEMVDDEATPDMLQLGGDVVTSGDGVAVHLCLLAALEDVLDAQILGRMYERVLCASGCSDDELAALEEVILHCQNADTAQLIRLCSAIAETRTTDKVTLIFEQLEEMDISVRAEL